MANPTLLTSPIAENGDKNVIPATTGATTGLLDQEHGFQQINELPLQAGGLPPQRKDFNGAFNLLSKILFYVQKGYVFEFDENQEYYAGCVVKDTDGGLYCANTDVSASSTHPKDDATNWALINFGFNHKETFTSSGSFTAPVTGTYRITLQGGGGGGQGGCKSGNASFVGGGGGAGANYSFYEKLVSGSSYSYTIGAGGTGGTGNSSSLSSDSIKGSKGGNSIITINGHTYTARGGGGASHLPPDTANGGYGGSFYVDDNIISEGRGFSGHTGSFVPYSSLATNTGISGALGGGAGALPRADGSVRGAGGTGGSVAFAGVGNGLAGGDGYIAFEYCDI